MADLLTPAHLLDVLEGNRRLTVRTLEAFSEQDLFSYAAPGMRPFADLVKEILGIETAYIRGIATGEWVYSDSLKEINTKQGLLDACEAEHRQLLEWWPSVTAERLAAVEDDGFFGAGPTPNLGRVIYSLENEIHHRGQGYVYLRLLGIEPPAFYER